MNVTVYYPVTPQNISELTQIVSSVHSEALNSYMAKLDCTKVEKFRLINAAIQEMHIDESQSGTVHFFLN